MNWFGRKDPAIMGALAAGRWEPTGPLLQLPFVVFDTETTGFHPYGGDRIIAIAAVRMGTDAAFETLVNPERPIPPVVTDLTGIGDDTVRQAPTIDQVLGPFFTFAGRSVLAAHCAPFDRAFLGAALKKAAGARWVHPLLDTQAVARALFPSWGDYRLEHCATCLATPVAGRHTALGDAKTTQHLLAALLAEAAARGLHTWTDLQVFLHNRQMW